MTKRSTKAPCCSSFYVSKILDQIHQLIFSSLTLLSIDERATLLGDIEVEKESDNESSGSEDEDRSGKFDFGPPLLFSGDSIDLDNLPDNIKSRIETITIRRQMVGKLG